MFRAYVTIARAGVVVEGFGGAPLLHQFVLAVDGEGTCVPFAPVIIQSYTFDSSERSDTTTRSSASPILIIQRSKVKFLREMFNMAPQGPISLAQRCANDTNKCSQGKHRSFNSE